MNTETKTDREQFLDDMITTAVEGGIGYWSLTTHYSWSDDGPTEAFIVDLESPGCDICGEDIVDTRNEWEQILKAPIDWMTLEEFDIWKKNQQKPITIDHLHSPQGHVVNRHVIERALVEMSKHSVKHLNDEARQRIVLAFNENEGGLLDSLDADSIVQFALFDEVRYG